MTTFKRYNGTDWEYVGLPNNVGLSPQTIAYAEQPSALTGLTTALTDITGLSVTVVVPEGRRIRISSSVIALQGTAVENKASTYIMEGATKLGFGEQALNPTVGTSSSIQAEVILSPSAGAHTYKLAGQFFAGSSNQFYRDPTNGQVCFILVEDITGSTLPYSPSSIPVGRLSYSERTADQTTITARVPITGLSGNIVVPAGRSLKVTLHGGLSRTVADGVTRVFIMQDGATVQFKDYFVRGALEGHVGMELSVVLSPSAGAHTYSAEVQQVTGTGSSNIGASVGEPTFLLVEDITSTPSPGTGAPGSTLGYAQITANQAITSSNTDIAGLSVNVNVPAGRRLRISALGEVQNTQGGINYVVGRILEGATQLQEDIVPLGATGGNNQFGTVTPSVIVTPSAGSHTYKLVGAAQTVGSTWLASATAPSYILVEDITGAIWPLASPVTAGLFSSEAWTTYVPSHTGITIGDGTQTAAYMKLGRTVHVRWTFVLGGTSSIGADPRIGLPFAANVATGLRHVGSLNLLDTGVRNWCGISLIHESDSTHAFMTHTESGNAGTVNATNPFTWGSTDAIVMSMTYEAVS